MVERTMEEEGSIRDGHRPDLGSSLPRPSSIEASRPSMDSLPDLTHSTEVMTSMAEIRNLELGEGSPSLIDDVEGLVGQIVLHGDDDCVVQRGGGHVVAGDVLPISGLQVCPPSPLSPSPLVAGGVHGCGGALTSTMDSGELRGSGLDKVSNYPALETLCDEAFADGRAGKWDLQNSADSLLRSDMVSRSLNGVLHCVPVLDDGEQQVVAESTLQRGDAVKGAVPLGSDEAGGSFAGGRDVDGGVLDVDLQPLPNSRLRASSFCAGSNLPETAMPVWHPLIPPIVGSGGGTVSEEVRVLPVVREAMRPQPTDGLRQPSSAPVEPVSVVESRGGQDGLSGGRSYAHVVQ
ncbi:hypothetical protein Dimus_010660, partial [Dionaea muscipula]